MFVPHEASDPDPSHRSRRTDDDVAPFWANLQELIQPGQFTNWFGRVRAQRNGEAHLVLLAPNAFVAEWIGRYFEDALQVAARRALGDGAVVQIEIAPESGASLELPGPFLPAGRRESPVPESPPRPTASPPRSDHDLREEFTFENFVVGAGNRFAHAAARAIVQDPGRSYNPLFLHGSVGLGKTHLLQAICRELRKQMPDQAVVYISCETFVNEFIQALESRTTAAFRDRFRSVASLIVDDIHLLSNKERSQEEFFHTFNQLYLAGKQIVLSSDAPPNEVPQLEKRLVTRFEMGLVAEIDPPDYETRVNIVRRKAKMRGVTLPDEVVHLIAEHVATNIRELEGAVLRVIAFASLGEQPLDETLARRAILRDGSNYTRSVGIEDIVEAVCAEFRVRLADLQSKRRHRSIALPRQIAMYLARKYTNLSYKEIAGYFGGRDHATAIYADGKIMRAVENDPVIRDAVIRIERRLEGRRR